MRKSNIEKALNAKINKWLDSIGDKELEIELRSGIIVTGGCIVSMLSGEEVSDYDIYFRTKALAKRVSEYYCSKFNEQNTERRNRLGYTSSAWVLDGEDVEAWRSGKKQLTEFCLGYTNPSATPSGMISNTSKDQIKIIINSDGIATADDTELIDEALDSSVDAYVDAVNKADEVKVSDLEQSEHYKPIFLSTNAITLTNKIQLVIRFYGEPDIIHSNYDFLHCTCYWTSWEKKVVWTTEALDCIINKDLFYRGSKYPICSIIRTRKFIKRGWNINAGQYLKMAFQVSQLDLTDINVLEDQLAGVDSLYFAHAISALRKVSEEKQALGEKMDFDSTYLATIVDKIFK